MAINVRKGQHGHLKFTTVPALANIDMQDVAPSVTSSHPDLIEMVTDENGSGFSFHAPAGTAGVGTVTAAISVDGDQDAGEVRIISGSVQFNLVDGAVEPATVSAELDGAILDD